MYSTSWTLEIPVLVGETIVGYCETDCMLMLDESCGLIKVGLHPWRKDTAKEWISAGADGQRGMIWDMAVAAVEADRWRIAVEAGIPPEPLPEEYRPIKGVYSRGRLVG